MTPLPTGKDVSKHTGRKDWLNMAPLHSCLFRAPQWKKKTGSNAAKCKGRAPGPAAAHMAASSW